METEYEKSNADPEQFMAVSSVRQRDKAIISVCPKAVGAQGDYFYLPKGSWSKRRLFLSAQRDKAIIFDANPRISKSTHLADTAMANIIL